MNTVIRVKELEVIKAHLEKEGNPHYALSNVNSPLAAYRRRLLVWHMDKVTYWSDGKQLCKPEAFDWDRLLEWDNKVNGYAFWVEGVSKPAKGRGRCSFSRANKIEISESF